jgi:hypothetical protein
LIQKEDLECVILGISMRLIAVDSVCWLLAPSWPDTGCFSNSATLIIQLRYAQENIIILKRTSNDKSKAGERAWTGKRSIAGETNALEPDGSSEKSAFLVNIKATVLLVVRSPGTGSRDVCSASKVQMIILLEMPAA